MAGTSGYSNLDVIHHIYSTRVQASTSGQLLSGQEAFISHAKRKNPSFVTNIPADLAQLFMDYGNRIKSDSLYDKIFRKVFAVLLRQSEGIATNKFERIFSLYFLPRDGRRIHDDWIMTMLMMVNDLINSVLRSNDLLKATNIIAKARLVLIPDNRNVFPVGFWLFEGWRQAHAQLMDPNRPLCLMTKEVLLQSTELPRVEVKTESMASWRTKFVRRKGRIGVGISPDNTNRKIIYGFILTSLETIRGYAEARRIQYTVGALSERDSRVDGLVGIATEMKKHNTYKRLVEEVMKRCMNKTTPQAQIDEFIRQLTTYIIGPTCNSSEQIASACLLLLDLMISYLDKRNFNAAVEALYRTMVKVFNERRRKYLMDNIWDEFQNRDKEVWLRSGHFNFMNSPSVLTGSLVTELTAPSTSQTAPSTSQSAPSTSQTAPSTSQTSPSTSQTAGKTSNKRVEGDDPEQKRLKLVTATLTLLPGQSTESQSTIKIKPKVDILQNVPSPQLTSSEDVPPLASATTNIIQVKVKHRYIDGPLPGSIINLPGITLEDSHRSQAAGHFVQRKDASSKHKNKSRKTATSGAVTAPATSGAAISTATSGKTRTTISGATRVATTPGTTRVATTSGTTRVATTSGATRVATTSGTTRVTATSGTTRVTTTSGTPTVATASGTPAVATTSGTPTAATASGTVATTSGATTVATTYGATIPSTAANVAATTTAQAEMVDVFLPAEEIAPIDQEVDMDTEIPGLVFSLPEDYGRQDSILLDFEESADALEEGQVASSLLGQTSEVAEPRMDLMDQSTSEDMRAANELFNITSELFPMSEGFWGDFPAEGFTSPPLPETDISTNILPAQGDTAPSQGGQQQASGDNPANPDEPCVLDQLDDEEFWQQFAN